MRTAVQQWFNAKRTFYGKKRVEHGIAKNWTIEFCQFKRPYIVFDFDIDIISFFSNAWNFQVEPSQDMAEKKLSGKYNNAFFYDNFLYVDIL